MALTKLVAGNWKMNGLAAHAAVLDAIVAAQPAPTCDVLVCPPATLLSRLAGRGIALGGQDCHADAEGAHTGDVSVEMLADAGATAVIVGHSERRTDHGESEAVVAAKVTAVQRAGLLAILCIGETAAEREAGAALDRIAAQLAGSLPGGVDPGRVVVAYEPIWAIGTGKTPSVSEIAVVHGFLRKTLQDRFGADDGGGVRLLYGGSVNAKNAADIFAVADVDGALVGGASLKPADFAAIIQAAG